jgi:anion-transporting  ArsA/GET3 family ATPase
MEILAENIFQQRLQTEKDLWNTQYQLSLQSERQQILLLNQQIFQMRQVLDNITRVHDAKTDQIIKLETTIKEYEKHVKIQNAELEKSNDIKNSLHQQLVRITNELQDERKTTSLLYDKLQHHN